MLRETFRLSFPCLLTVLAAAQRQEPVPVPGAEAPPTGALLLQRTAERYREPEWPRGARRAGFALGAVELRGYRGGEVEASGSLPLQRRFADAAGEARVMLEVLSGETGDDARRQVLGWLAHVSKPGLVPSAAAEGLPVGDAGYVGWSKPAERRIAWIVFVRDNVAVRVVCLDPRVDPHPDLAAIAQQVDAAIAREPVVAEGPLPRPRITKLAAARASCRAGEDVALTVEATDAAGVATPPALRFELDGTGQGHVEADEHGRWRLRTTGAGRVSVRAIALGARGLTTAAVVTVDVLPR